MADGGGMSETGDGAREERRERGMGGGRGRGEGISKMHVRRRSRLEQFVCGAQLLQFTEVMRQRKLLNETELLNLRVLVFGGAAVVVAMLAGAVLPAGYFGPLSARVRGLFIKHTRTGNPLVDSVAEHQATPPTVYWQYYHIVCLVGPIGTLACFFNRTDAKIFFLLYAFVRVPEVLTS